MYAARSQLRCLLQSHLYFTFLGQGLLLNLKLSDWQDQMSSRSQGSAGLCFSRAGITCVNCHTWRFNVDFGNGTWSSLFVQQALCPLICLSTPPLHLLMTCISGLFKIMYHSLGWGIRLIEGQYFRFWGETFQQYSGALKANASHRLLYLHAWSPAEELFGRIGRHGLVRGGVQLGVSIEVSNTHTRLTPTPLPLSAC